MPTDDFFPRQQVPTVTTGGTRSVIAGPVLEWRVVPIADMSRDQLIAALYQAAQEGFGVPRASLGGCASTARELAAKQEPLGAEFERVWNANTDKLYED